MIDLDLPPVEIDLQQLFQRTAQVAGQQIGRIAIVQLFAVTLAIRSRRNDDQAQRTSAGATLPVDSHNLFIANLAPLAAVEDFGSFPGAALILTHLLGSKLLDPIKPAGNGRGAKTQPGISAGPDQHHRPFWNLAKASTVTEAAVAGQHQDLAAAPSLVQLLPQLL